MLVGRDPHKDWSKRWPRSLLFQGEEEGDSDDGYGDDDDNVLDSAGEDEHEDQVSKMSASVDCDDYGCLAHLSDEWYPAQLLVWFESKVFFCLKRFLTTDLWFAASDRIIIAVAVISFCKWSLCFKVGHYVCGRLEHCTMCRLVYYTTHDIV